MSLATIKSTAKAYLDELGLDIDTEPLCEAMVERVPDLKYVFATDHGRDFVREWAYSIMGSMNAENIKNIENDHASDDETALYLDESEFERALLRAVATMEYRQIRRYKPIADIIDNEDGAPIATRKQLHYLRGVCWSDMWHISERDLTLMVVGALSVSEARRALTDYEKCLA